MDWGRRRQVYFALIVTLALVVSGILFWYGFIYQVPTCSDGAMNQNELGIDCGGECDRLCKAPSVDVEWARGVRVADGVYHAVAKIHNPLLNARGVNIPYTFSLYDAETILVATRKGVLDLQPGESRALFEPAVLTGKRAAQKAFLEVGEGAWTRSEVQSNPVQVLTQTAVNEEARSFDVQIENTSSAPVSGVLVTALLFDANELLVNASQSKVSKLGGLERRTITFTWPEAFSAPVVRADVQIRLEP